MEPDVTSGTVGSASGGGATHPNQNQLPWHLIPAFKPGTTDVNDYARRLNFLCGIWPSESLSQLAPRAALLTEGSAFQKIVRLDPSKLRVNSSDGVRLIVQTLGGVWGKTTLENRYERFERAIFSTVQRPDETHESFIARHEVQFEDLLSDGASLEDIRAYVLLRNSGLSADEKKKIIVDAGGNLKYSKVLEALRLLGSRFFHEVQSGNRQPQRQKTYDVNYVQDETEDLAYTMSDDVSAWEPGEITDHCIDQLASEGDEDALIVHQFEDSLIDAVQSDPELCVFMTTYSEARRRLTEKTKFRGFWPVNPKGKGKGKSKNKGYRKPLALRIAESHCRRCGQKGHWKAECPSNPANSVASSNTTSSRPHATNAAVMEAHFTMPGDDWEDVLEGDPELESQPVVWSHQVGCPGDSKIHESCILMCVQSDSSKGNPFGKKFCQQVLHRLHRSHEPRAANLNKDDDLIHTTVVKRTPLSQNEDRISSEAKVDSPQGTPEIGQQTSILHQVPQDVSKIQEAMFVSQGCQGIVDLGASQTVMGEYQLGEFLRDLPKDVRAKVREQKVSMTFRFGNNSTVACDRAILVPVQRYWIRIAIVKSKTPFLLSNSMFRKLGAVIDTKRHVVHFEEVPCTVPLSITERKLFTLSVAELIEVAQKCKTPTTVEPTSENVLITECVSESQSLSKNKVGAMNHTECVHPESVNVVSKHSESISQQTPVHTKSPHNVAVLPKDPISCDPISVTVCDNSCHVEGTSQSVQTGEQQTEQPREGTRVDQSTHERSTGEDHPFRSNSPWQEVSYSGALGTPVLQLVHRSLGGIDQRGTSRISSLPQHVHRAHGEVSGDSKSQSEERALLRVSDAQGQGRKQDESWSNSGQWQVLPTEVRGRDPQRIRMVRGANGLSTVGSHRPDDGSHEPSRAEHAGSHEQYRRCPDDDCEPVATAGAASEQSAMSAMTPSEYQELKCVCEAYNEIINNSRLCDAYWSDNMTKNKIPQENPVLTEMNEYFRANKHRFPQNMVHKYDLLEIYCSSDSQLTKEAIRLGQKAIRFGLKQGDLSNSDGRKRLYECLMRYQPRDVWMSPSCKAWCRWNQFNASKSPEAARKVMNARDQETIHMLLCDAVCQHQINHSRHFHLEQPGGSDMMYQSEMTHIVEQTYRATCDQCTAGKLKHPSSLMPLKKNMQIFTTSKILAHMIDNLKCSRDHPHDHVAGSFVDMSGQRQPVSQFTELYTATFAKRVCRALMASQAAKESINQHLIFVEDVSQKDDRESKRRRLEVKQNRPTAFEPEPARPNLNESVASPHTSQVGHKSVMEEALEIAPKVGTSIIEQGPFFDRIQSFFKSHKIRVIELCKGADRCRRPPIRLAPNEASHRATIGIHRVSKATFIKDWENWETLKGKDLTAKTQPARLLVTVFGSPVDLTSQSINDKRRDIDHPDEPNNKKIRIEGPKDIPENPIPVPKGGETKEVGEAENSPMFQHHGPKFLQLSAEDRQWLKKVHSNLGHPHAERLRKTLQLQSCSKEILDAIDDFRCSTCHELQRPKIPRPAAISDVTEFNQCIGCDLVTWSTKEGKRHTFFHVVDMATSFQLAQPVYQTSQEALQDAFNRTWMHWAGPPQELVIDGESALCSEDFRNFTQRHSIQTRVVAAYAHWQMGKVERHGGILQGMLDKYHHDRPINTPQEFEEAVSQCCNAKNALSRAKGYTPEILVLGKSSRVPGSVVSEPYDSSQYLMINPQAESSEFFHQLQRRETARKAFIQIDNDQATRRAVLRRVRPHRGHHAPGTYVMYWRQNKWCGPGRVIHQEDQHVVWISHIGRIFRVAPEHVRLLSEREIQSSWKNVQELSPLDLPTRSGHGVFQYEDLINQPATVPNNQNLEFNDVQNHIPETGVIVNNGDNPDEPSTSIGHDQPDAEPDHSQTEESITEVPSGVNGIDVPIPDDSTDEAFISEDYWIIQGDKITRVHNKPRKAVFRPLDSSDCPIDVFLLLDDRQTQGKFQSGEVWNHKDSWPSDHEHWSKDMSWTGTTTFQVMSSDCQESQDDIVTHDAFVLQPDMCWEYEIFLTETDQEAIAARPHEYVSLIASAAKRQRAEVRMTELTPEHKAEFQTAKDKEVSQWLDTETVRKILRSKIPMENILRTRWVLTWKALDPNDVQPGKYHHKAKARLVVLGYEDPNIEDIPRDSPTLQKESRSLIIQYCVSKRWEIQSFDIKTAFLRGSRRDERLLGIEPPSEMRDKMKLKEEEICELRKSAYGLVNAPYLWFQELREALLALKFVQCPLDPCLFSLPGLHGSIHGLIGIHVDDGLACGDTTFERTIKDLEKRFPFGSHRRKHFVFTGIQIDQDEQSNITLSQSEYVNKIDFH